MERICVVVVVFTLMNFQSCKRDESVQPPVDENAVRLVLTADKVTGSAPLPVNFTGKLYGKIDTLRMKVPDMILYPGAGRTIIRYALPDSSRPARSTYTDTFTYPSGIHNAVMLLQGKNRDIWSDTLTITAQ